MQTHLANWIGPPIDRLNYVGEPRPGMKYTVWCDEKIRLHGEVPSSWVSARVSRSASSSAPPHSEIPRPLTNPTRGRPKLWRLVLAPSTEPANTPRATANAWAHFPAASSIIYDEHPQDFAPNPFEQVQLVGMLGSHMRDVYFEGMVNAVLRWGP